MSFEKVRILEKGSKGAERGVESVWGSVALVECQPSSYFSFKSEKQLK